MLGTDGVTVTAPLVWSFAKRKVLARS
jgi:hypothetical protein